MNKKDRIYRIKALLIRDFPIVMTPLRHSSAFQLLIATVLSAQTLDETVNKVTDILFTKYPDVVSLSKAKFEDVDSIIKIINYHKTKAKNIILLSLYLLQYFDGKVPYTIDELIRLPGVGRKTANVVISEWFAKPIDRRGNTKGVVLPTKFDNNYFVNEQEMLHSEKVLVGPQGFVVDTHVKRVSNRLGLTKKQNPQDIEKDLMKIFSRCEWPEMSLRLIFHGRYRCKSKKCECYKDSEWKELCRCCHNKQI